MLIMVPFSYQCIHLLVDKSTANYAGGHLRGGLDSHHASCETCILLLTNAGLGRGHKYYLAEHIKMHSESAHKCLEHFPLQHGHLHVLQKLIFAITS